MQYKGTPIVVKDCNRALKFYHKNQGTTVTVKMLLCGKIQLSGSVNRGYRRRSQRWKSVGSLSMEI